MILLESEIRQIAPYIFGTSYRKERVQPASYDLTINLSPAEILTEEARPSFLRVGPLQRVLLTTTEAVSIPVELAAEVRIRSTAARKGWICPPTLVDPGFMGHITLELFNSSSSPLEITQEGLVQLILIQGSGTTTGYDGRYQFQYGTTRARSPQ